METADAAVFALRILQRGSCTAGDQLVAPAEQEAQQNVLDAALSLQSAQGSVTPGDVVRSLAVRGKKLPPSTLVRALMRRLRRKRKVHSRRTKRGAQAKAAPITWTQQFSVFVDSIAQDPNFEICDLVQGEQVTSFSIVAKGLLDWLAQMHAEEPVTFLAAQSDHTFNLEWMGYVFGCVGVTVHRKLEGRWRKSFIPLVWRCWPREDKQNYRALFKTLAAQLESRGLPKPKQLNSDHFGGIPRQFRKVFPGSACALSLWHLKKNLRKNGAAAKSKGLPRLTARPIGVALHWCTVTATLPTKLMFGVAWEHILRRVKTVYRDQRWALYFRKRYLLPGQAGRENSLTARWHYGAQSLLHHGHPPSHQPVEQQNSALKRMLESTGRCTDLITLLTHWRAQVAAWCTEPQDTENSFSLKAPRAHFATDHPHHPDDWMLGVHRQQFYIWALSSVVHLAPLPKWLAVARAQGQQAYRRRVHRPGTPFERIFYGMAAWSPEEVPEEWFDQAIKQLMAKTRQDLHSSWQLSGIMIDTPEEDHRDEVAFKMSMPVLRNFWVHRCITVALPASIRCTCCTFAQLGHCVHKYLVAELEDRQPHLGAQWQRAGIGARHLRRLQKAQQRRDRLAEGMDD